MSPPRGFLAPPLFPDDQAEGPRMRATAETSREAWDRVKTRRRAIYDRILAIVRASGRAGATLTELAVALDKEKSAFSGRPKS